MADNVVILDANGAPITVGTDEVTSINGATVPAVQVQREKVGFGGNGVLLDVSAANPLPVTDAAQATVHTDLAALLTELSQKLEPGDLNLLATAAKQDVTHTDLVNLLTALAGTLTITDATPSFAGPQAQSGADVGTTSTAVVGARAGRSMLHLINVSDTAMWVGLDTSTGGTPASTTGSGIWLGPNGGSWAEGYTGAARAHHVGASGTKRLAYLEW